MAILISKQRAQGKRAMTRQAIANSTLTESLFLLEDTMWPKKILRESKRQVISRNDHNRQAREIMKQFYPELSRDFWFIHLVHHIDGNPFNNDLSNLKIIAKSVHKKIHSIMNSNP